MSPSLSGQPLTEIIRRNDYTRKRGTRPNNKYSVLKGMQFLNGIRDIYRSDPSKFASIDEMSVMLNSAPSYGYARRGQRAVILQPSKRTVSRMLTLCISCSGVIHWDLREGAITGKVFSEILRKLPDGLTLMLDNSPVESG